MFKNNFSRTAIILIFTLLLSSLSLAAAPAREQILGSSLPSGIQLESQIPDGLTAADWSQIQALMDQQDHRAALSPLDSAYIIQQAYLKASNTDAVDQFGFSVAVSGDTVVIGANGESSKATGVNGYEDDDSAGAAGAAYVFVRSGTDWSQQAYLKASNTGAQDYFGCSVAVSGDAIVVGAYGEDSNATGVDGYQYDESAANAGAAYVFVRSGTSWSQEAYLKASNTGADDFFGRSVAVSGDTIVIGAYYEDSKATGVNGDDADDSAAGAGAAYVFVKKEASWSQQAYLKASNTDEGDNFGYSVAVSGDTVVVGADAEASNATGVGGDEGDDSAFFAGAAYVFVRSDTTWSQQAYLKASNTNGGDEFGVSVAVSGDTAVVGAHREASNATGVDGEQTNNLAPDSGAAYIFFRDGSSWSQQAYLKASNTETDDGFGNPISVSGDTVVVGAYTEDSNATGVNGAQVNNLAPDSGAVYVFVRSKTGWSQQAYLKASNTDAGDIFGNSVAISDDTIVVGAHYEDSSSKGVDGDQTDNSAPHAGAAYVFVRSGDNWNQQAYLKASNTEAEDYFGFSVAVSGDTIVIGAAQEDSNATGVNGVQDNNSANWSGASYIFVRSGTSWSQQAYLKASNTDALDIFGCSVAISGDTVVAGAYGESSSATGVNGDEDDNTAFYSGAAYVFIRSGIDWSQQAYLKASNTGAGDWFGRSVSMSGDTVVVGAPNEDSSATGVNGDEDDDSAASTGAAYVFFRSWPNWSQQAYLKASNTDTGDLFGFSVEASGDTVVVGAYGESSSATGVNGNQNDNSSDNSGAAYVFFRSGTSWCQQSYVKSSNTDAGDLFGISVATSGDKVVAGAFKEDSNATGVNGLQYDNSAPEAGAAYVFAIYNQIFYLPIILRAILP